jgi:hypothetical protein
MAATGLHSRRDKGLMTGQMNARSGRAGRYRIAVIEIG